MSQSKRDLLVPKKLRFRRDSGQRQGVEDVYDGNGDSKRSSSAGAGVSVGVGVNRTTRAAEESCANNEQQQQRQYFQQGEENSSFLDFFKVELTRGYMLEHDEERYAARRQKIYSFMRIPRDLERFIVYGIMQCADSFLYIHTFLPVRFAMAMWALLTRPIARCFGLRHRTQRLLTPAEICDILKSLVWLVCIFIMISVDTNRVYHIIKSQSIIKLYIFYNMLEVGDRLLSAFGQDTIDALFWTATEPKHSKREHLGLLAHMVFALFYIILHTSLIMFQATTLNVALNSNNKGLLTIMMSNNFVELKGSVFKKFDKNNLFQLTCSDVRERFHLSVLLFIVMLQTMKEFDWSFAQFCIMLPDCFAVLITEVLIDWIKHAFITRFNELPEGIYREYTTSLAYDMTQTRQKHAFSDHSDLVARRMGFIPFPLGVVLIKAIYSAVSFDNLAAWMLLFLAYLFVLGLRICLTICALGKACKLMKEHQEERSSSTPSSMTNVPPVSHTTNTAAMPGVSTLPRTPLNVRQRPIENNSPLPSHLFQRSITLDLSQHHGSSSVTTQPSHYSSTPKSVSKSKAKPKKMPDSPNDHDIELDVTNSLELGATALFSNSDVDLDGVRLNEHVLDQTANTSAFIEEELARSEPDLSQQPISAMLDNHVTAKEAVTPSMGRKKPNSSLNCGLDASSGCTNGSGSASGSGSGRDSGSGSKTHNERPINVPKRTHRRSESEPFKPSSLADADNQT